MQKVIYCWPNKRKGNYCIGKNVICVFNQLEQQTNQMHIYQVGTGSTVL